jgi:hypothetical protein
MPAAMFPHHPALWRGDALSRAEVPGLATGFSALDEVLPGGGWPVGALSEILIPCSGIGEIRLCLPALARLVAAGRPVFWISPPFLPYAPALSRAGLDPDRLLIVRPPHARDTTWVAEQVLRSGACGAMLTWLHTPDFARLRRLQLAAEAGQGWGVIFRPVEEGALSSPAPLRLILEPGRKGLAVRILKRRGGMLNAPVVIDLVQ